ncbi:hypothetical protein, partial [Streptomyces scabiei]|uniref:hypothetical protein n=1 Tax=Streptomyces scabiei TaxID=1930 RepID=UPI0038F6C442
MTLSESMAAGSVSALSTYRSSISCSNANATSTVLPSGTGTSFSLTPQVGDAITCTLTNTPPTTVSVQKITNIGSGGPFSFSRTNLAS